MPIRKKIKKKVISAYSKAKGAGKKAYGKAKPHAMKAYGHAKTGAKKVGAHVKKHKGKYAAGAGVAAAGMGYYSIRKANKPENLKKTFGKSGYYRKSRKKRKK